MESEGATVKKLLLLALLFLPTAALAQIGAFNGFCDRGGVPAVTQGLKSSNNLQGDIPSCTVTVYLTGTTTLAKIYADSSGTALANPFTANNLASVAPGKWLFWAAVNSAYDIIGSGGIAPNVYPAPVPLCIGCYPSAQFTVVGGSTITPGYRITCTPFNGVDCTGNVTVNWSDPTSASGDIIYRDNIGLQRLPIGSEGYVLGVSNQLPEWEPIQALGGPPQYQRDACSTAPTLTTSASINVTKGDLLLVLTSNNTYGTSDPNVPATLTDSQGLTWTQDATAQGFYIGGHGVTTAESHAFATASGVLNVTSTGGASSAQALMIVDLRAVGVDVAGADAGSIGASSLAPSATANFANEQAIVLVQYYGGTATSTPGSPLFTCSPGGGAYPQGSGFEFTALNPGVATTANVAFGSSGFPAAAIVLLQNSLGYGTMSNPMYAANQMIVGGPGGAPTALLPGTDGYVLTMVSGAPAWAADSGGGGLDQLTGDVTAGPGTGSQVATLATVNGSPGTCGDATNVCQVTTNGKGLVTGQTAVPITNPASVASINSTAGAFTFSFSAGAGSCSGTTCTFTGSGTGAGSVTNFIANTADWPTWLVPTVTSSTTTPTLAVAASAIPNSALAHSTLTLGATTLTLGATTTAVTGLGVDGATSTELGYSSGVTSAIQTQLNGKQASLGYTPAHAGGNFDITSLNGLTTPLSVAQGGTGTASPGLVAGSNVTVTGTWPNQTISATASGGGTTTNAVTFNNSGIGAPSGTTFDGSAARTISTNTIGAVPTSTTVNGHALSANVVVSASDLTTGTLPHAQLPALVSADIPNNAASTSGTAAALTATPAQCSGGKFATGITAAGAANCNANLDDGNTTVNTLTYTGSAGIAAKAFKSTAATIGLLQLGAQAFSKATTCNSGAQFTIENFTDSTVTTVGTTITGGGSHAVVGICNGTNWVVMVDLT